MNSTSFTLVLFNFKSVIFKLKEINISWKQVKLQNNSTRNTYIVSVPDLPFVLNFNFSGDYIISIGMQEAFEPLLYEYKVDLAFWAHYHSYERTCPVYLQKCTPGAPVHIVVGTAGKNLDTEDYFPMSWSLYHENNYGYGRLTQANRSALHWEWVENTSGVVKDHVWLTKWFVFSIAHVWYTKDEQFAVAYSKFNHPSLTFFTCKLCCFHFDIIAVK